MSSNQSRGAPREPGDFPQAHSTLSPHLTSSTANCYTPRKYLGRQIGPQHEPHTPFVPGGHQDGIQSQTQNSAARMRAALRAVDAWRAECDRYAARVGDSSYSAPSAEHLAVRELSWEKAVAARRATRQTQRETTRDNQNDTTKSNLGKYQQMEPPLAFRADNITADIFNKPYRPLPTFPSNIVAPKPEVSSGIGGVPSQDQYQASTFLQFAQERNQFKHYGTARNSFTNSTSSRPVIPTSLSEPLAPGPRHRTHQLRQPLRQPQPQRPQAAPSPSQPTYTRPQQQQSVSTGDVSVATANSMLDLITQRHQQQEQGMIARSRAHLESMASLFQTN